MSNPQNHLQANERYLQERRQVREEEQKKLEASDRDATLRGLSVPRSVTVGLPPAYNSILRELSPGQNAPGKTKQGAHCRHIIILSPSLTRSISRWEELEKDHLGVILYIYCV